jgi:hypothetical protein
VSCRPPICTKFIYWRGSQWRHRQIRLYDAEWWLLVNLNNALRRIWKGGVLIYFEVYYARTSLEGLREPPITSVQAVWRPSQSFRLGTSRTEGMSITYRVKLFFFLRSIGLKKWYGYLHISSYASGKQLQCTPTCDYVYSKAKIRPPY